MTRLSRATQSINVALLATACSFALLAAQPSAHAAPAAKQQLKPVLRAIDPSQAKVEEPTPDPQEAAAPPATPNPQMEQMIPEFGKADPEVPPSMARPMPPGPGFGSGYAPAPAVQAPSAPDDPRVARLEQIAFGSAYPEHETDDRVEHLEREVFGRTNPGDLESRIQKLEAKLGGGQGAFANAPQLGAGRSLAPYMPPQQAQYQNGQQPQRAYQPPLPAYMPPQQRQPAYGTPPQTAYQPPQQPTYQPPPPTYQQPAFQQSYPMPTAQPTYQQPYQQPSYPPMQQVPYPPQLPQQQPTQPPYQQPAQTAYQQPTQPAYQPPVDQPYEQPAQPYQQPAPPPYQQPYEQTTPSSTSAPPSIPQGPITMDSFKRRPNPPAQPVQPPQVAVQPPPTKLQPPTMSRVPPVSTAAGASNMGFALENMPYDKKVGDYSPSILRMAGSFARWTTLPVRIHVPMNTPETWRAPIEMSVKKWGQFLPTMIAPAHEPADIEIGWINHLSPRQLGITNLEIFNGRPRVTVYLLRPNYYPPDVPDTMLQKVAMHEIGHALGLFGHSSNPGDIMFAIDSSAKANPKATSVSQRDINTLRRIYESPPLPEGFQSPQPISWPFLDNRPK